MMKNYYAFLKTSPNTEFREFGIDCGYANIYVAVPPDHPLYGKSYDWADKYVEAPGGLTYAESAVNLRRVRKDGTTECIGFQSLDEIGEDWWVLGMDTVHEGWGKTWDRQRCLREAAGLGKQMEKLGSMREMDGAAGLNIDSALGLLKAEATKSGSVCYMKFNGELILSTDTVDEAYVRIIGKSKAEFERDAERRIKNLEKEAEEHRKNILRLVEKYRKEARGLVLDDKLSKWDEILEVRVSDLYHGMELSCTLDICRVMRDESITKEERIRKATKLFYDQNHSGMSAGLVMQLLVVFCPGGRALVAAIQNRYC